MRNRSETAALRWREGRGWYGDYRNFADVGGKIEALIPPGERRATQDQAVGAVEFARRLRYYQDKRAGNIKDDDGPGSVPRITEYMDRHFKLKSVRQVTEERERRAIDRFVNVVGDLALDRISKRLVNDYQIERRAATGKRKGTTLGERTLEIEIQAISSLLDSAVEDEHLLENVIRSLRHRRRNKPNKGLPVWLELVEAWNLLCRAREMDAKPTRRGIQYQEALYATHLLTGGRKSEVWGLAAKDIDFKAGWVYFRPNEYRPHLKTPESERRVPLWPQLRAILTDHIAKRESGLLFPGRNAGMLTDLRGCFGKTLEAAGITKAVTWHSLRHTYCAMRLQTTDKGKPVSLWTVKDEMGHTTLGLIERIYGHLPEIRRRLSVVDYRPMTLAAEGSASA